MVGPRKWKNEEIIDWKEVEPLAFELPDLIRVYEKNILKYGAVVLAVNLKIKKLHKLDQEPESIAFDSDIRVEKAITAITQRKKKEKGERL